MKQHFQDISCNQAIISSSPVSCDVSEFYWLLCGCAKFNLVMYFKYTTLAILYFCVTVLSRTEEDEGVKYANKCEVCKVLALELEERLKETGKSRDVIETGYALDDVKPKKKKEYHKSELRLIESLEGVCDRILEYNIHKEREDSTRFAKGMSQTFQTLHGLVDKGVKVELGIPYELWDKPSVEVTNMKSQCETVLEQNEGDVEEWYWNHQEIPLKFYLCKDRFLKGEDSSCLDEKFKGDKGKSKSKSKKKDQTRQDNENEKEEL